tara:strand:- start:655 stop:924 length:270 start_codon:yes stop_codon:yes gene_type:complete
MILEITLGIVSVTSIYVIVNLLRKLEKLETFIENTETEIENVQQEIKKIDDKGYFESDDEVGTKFKQLSEVIKTIQTLRGENDSNVTND